MPRDKKQNNRRFTAHSRLANPPQLAPAAQKAPQVLGYLGSHFDPQKLPQLLLALIGLKLRQTGSNIDCNLVHRNPSLCMLVSNMRLYNSSMIIRENALISQLEGHPTYNINEQPRVTTTSRMLARKGSEKSSNRGTAAQGRRGLVQQAELGYNAFKIYEYRLRDLNSLIAVLNDIVLKQMGTMTDTGFSRAQVLGLVAWQFQQLCDILLGKMGKIKADLESLSGIYLQADQSQGRQYYNLKLHAKLISSKLKQVQEKYTQMANQIVQRASKVKAQLDRLQIHSILKHSSPKYSQSQFKDSSDESLQNIELPPGMHSALAYLQNHQSYRSILKTSNNNVIAKLIEAKNKTRTNKRTSIDLMTDMLAQKNMKAKESRFMHRQGINIGSGRTIQKNGSLVLKKKPRKQVKIDEDSVNEGTHQVRTSKFKTGSQLKQFNTLQTQEQTQAKLITKGSQSKGLNSHGSLNKFYSDDEIYKARVGAFSCASIGSSRSGSRGTGRSKSRTSNTKSENKISSGYSFSGKRKRNSSKNKSKKQVSTSLNNIIMDALEKKGSRQRGSSKSRNALQSYKFIGSADSQGRRAQKNLKRVRANHLDKDKSNKYAVMLQQLISQNKQPESDTNKQGKLRQSEGESKSSRRIGMTMANDKQNKAQNEPKMSSQSKAPKTASQLTSNGSKKFHISNPRIKIEELNKQPRKQEQEGEAPIEYLRAPEHAKVNILDRQAFPADWVRLYPDMECSLHKIAKKYMKEQMCSNAIPGSNMLFEFVPMVDFKFKKQITAENYQHQIQQFQMKKRVFDKEGLELVFSRKFATAFNQLHQKEMNQLGKKLELSRTLSQSFNANDNMKPMC